MASRRSIILPALVACCFAGILAAGCEKTSEPEQGVAAPAKPADVLVFPSELRVSDDSVNEFVSRAMRVCGEGEYEPFRLLWSVKEDTLSRGDFEQGWQAVVKIQIRALQPVFLAADAEGSAMTGETIYVVLANVELDPAHRAGQNEPHREVALKVVKENGEWRLAKAAANIRKWIIERVANQSAEKESSPAATTGGERDTPKTETSGGAP